MAIHFRTLTVKDIRRETADCVSFAFEIPGEWKEEFTYHPGQNITVRATIGNEDLRRSYSICSSPAENELRIAVKQVTGGKLSTHLNEHLQTGDRLDILPPTGTFYTEINPAHQKSYLAFAAGSGITPVISIIKAVLAAEPNSEFTLVFGNRDRSSIIFKEQLEGIKNRYLDRFSIHHILSREKTDATIYTGRIDTAKCQLLAEKLINFKNPDEIFICGPEQMIFSIKDWLEQNGIDSRKIHFELFTTPGQKPGSIPIRSLIQKIPDDASSITIKSDGISFDFKLDYEGDSILDAAIKQGADLPFSCKGGVCCTCKARLLEGKVEMDVNWGLEPEELAAGYILTCQSHPRSKKIVIDFDSK